MVYFTSYYLRVLISEILRDTIELVRESKNTIYFDGDFYVAEQEIRDFIFSSPYFSLDLKEFLYNKNNNIFIGVEKNWFNNFIENVYLWSESDEWLHYDVKYICDPLLNMRPEIKELDLTPNNKAIVYCKRFF